MTRFPFSLDRLLAIMVKEFIQLRRDRMTFAMMIGIPLVQLLLFGYAINSDPKHLPTAIELRDDGPMVRSLISALEATGYYQIVETVKGPDQIEALFASGRVQFVVTVPEGFSRALVRGERPALLVEADATDPSATSNAVAALQRVTATALQHDLTGPWAALAPRPGPFEIRVHARYNPEGITRYNIVPGLIGVILTMTMVIMTALGVTRERERGTMENLLAMPSRPLEVMVGKIAPYVIIGYVQTGIILVTAQALFGVPILGSMTALSLALVLFIAANLALGFTISTLSQSQLQAMQASFFFMLPSILLSGFMFPFRGMPAWAQVIGEILPITHFLRVVRAIMLKGHGLGETAGEMLPILAFLLVISAIALARYRQTLD